MFYPQKLRNHPRVGTKGQFQPDFTGFCPQNPSHWSSPNGLKQGSNAAISTVRVIFRRFFDFLHC